MRYNQNNGREDREEIILLPKSVAQEILSHLENYDDKGPIYAGWQSNELLNCLFALQNAIEHARPGDRFISRTDIEGIRN